MKYLLMFVLLSSSCVYGMEGLNNKTKNPPYRNYYEEAVLGILGRYQDKPKPNAIENSEKIKQLPDNATPLEIVGFLKTLHDNNLYEININIKNIIRSKL